MKILGIVPARYASSRLPGKALEIIEGKSIICRVVEQASKCSLLDEVIVATDHEKIFNHVREFNGKVLMTSSEHNSGTDRCAEVVRKIGESYDYVINIQGDEPFIDPEQITLLASILDGSTQLATLIKKMDTDLNHNNPNVVKVIVNKDHEAIYFSRTKIPFERDPSKLEFDFYKHIGIYAYRNDILKEITSLEPSSLELAESLEQLRWIENGYRIKTLATKKESIGIDTREDLLKAREFAKNI